MVTRVDLGRSGRILRPWRSIPYRLNDEVAVRVKHALNLIESSALRVQPEDALPEGFGVGGVLVPDFECLRRLSDLDGDASVSEEGAAGICKETLEGFGIKGR